MQDILQRIFVFFDSETVEPQSFPLHQVGDNLFLYAFVVATGTAAIEDLALQFVELSAQVVGICCFKDGKYLFDSIIKKPHAVGAGHECPPHEGPLAQFLVFCLLPYGQQQLEAPRIEAVHAAQCHCRDERQGIERVDHWAEYKLK